MGAPTEPKLIMNMQGLPGMLKHGAEHHTGIQDAIIRNLEACQQLTNISRTSLGPNGMNKLIINHLEQLIVTSDSATILKEMEVQHPAAKMLVLAAHMQEQEIGDGTNLVVTFGGEALHQAEELLRKGLKPAEMVMSTKNVLSSLARVVADACIMCCPEKEHSF